MRDYADRSLRTEPGSPQNFTSEDLALGEMFEEYIDWRAEHPSDDIMTQLLQAEFEDETGATRRLTRNEILTYVNVIAGAGNETTTRLHRVGGQGARRPSRPAAGARRRPRPHPERDRGAAAVRATGAARRSVHLTRRRVPRRARSRRARRCCASWARPTTTTGASPMATASTSTARSGSTSRSASARTSAWAPSLARPRGPRRAGGAPAPVSRSGTSTVSTGEARVHLDGPRMGDVAGRRALPCRADRAG